MNILIMGMGYVGTTTALVFAELGFQVSGVDTDPMKIDSLKKGSLPIHEPGLDNLLRKHVSQGNIRFTTDPGAAVTEHSIIYLCVGTPSQPDGSANLEYIKQAAECIGRNMNEYKLIVIKSTVPPGTQRRLKGWVAGAQQETFSFDVVSNPEFLREGSALHDAFHPDRIIIGSDNEAAARSVQSLYDSLDCPVLLTAPTTAELIKYAANSFLATKISFINELARLCDHLDIPVSEVSEGVGLDPRIGKAFLRAGIGYGGSCFPKDVNALIHTAREQGTELSILERVVDVNQTQASYFIHQMERKLGDFAGKTIAVLGIAFKPGTDDLREAPALAVITQLLDRGALIKAHDPVAKLPAPMGTSRLQQTAALEDTVQDAVAVVLCTEWPEYVKADWSVLKKEMKQLYFFDGRNVLDRARMTAWGYDYQGIGNG